MGRQQRVVGRRRQRLLLVLSTEPEQLVDGERRLVLVELCDAARRGWRRRSGGGRRRRRRLLMVTVSGTLRAAERPVQIHRPAQKGRAGTDPERRRRSGICQRGGIDGGDVTASQTGHRRRRLSCNFRVSQPAQRKPGRPDAGEKCLREGKNSSCVCCLHSSQITSVVSSSACVNNLRIRLLRTGGTCCACRPKIAARLCLSRRKSLADTVRHYNYVSYNAVLDVNPRAAQNRRTKSED